MGPRRFILLFAALCMCIIFSRINTWKDRLFVYDKAGYHLYLPATLIYHDLGLLSFYTGIQKQYNPSGDEHWYAIYPQPTGKKLNKYAVGTALLQTPFFVAAHLYCYATNTYPADGYSLPYQLAAFISNVVWCLIGLLLLQIVLSRYYGNWTTLATLVCVALGTNLFYQTAYDIGSHVYSFTLIAAVLYFTDNWYRNYKNINAILIGIALGMVTITRPVNILAAVIPLLWQVYNLQTLHQRMALLIAKYMQSTVTLLCFLAIAFIQMAYWKYTTGHWIYFSYQGEGFNFTNPHVIDGLFSYRKGWFVYTPMAVVAMPGLYFLYRKHKPQALAITLFFILSVYTVFSWKNWWYGGGFSARAMVDYYAILALPFAAFFSSINASSKRWIRQLLAATCILLISLNVFQTWQFSEGIIHHDRMTKAYYWHIFGKTTYHKEDHTYLMSDKEYWDAMREAYD